LDDPAASRGDVAQEERIGHLNRILDAIREVDRMIARGCSREELLTETCGIMVRRRGFRYAWIDVDDREGKPPIFRSAGLTETDAAVLERMMRSGDLPACATLVLDGRSPVTSCDVAGRCRGCPMLGGPHEREGAITGRLEHAGRAYGVFSVSVGKEFLDDPQELELFREVSDDIAAALHSLELQEERERAGIRLRESENRFRSLFNASRIAIFLETIDGRILDCNDAACAMLGYTKDELLGMSVIDLMPEGMRARLEDLIRSEKDTGGLLVETENVRRDGRIIPVDVSTKLIETGGGTLVVAYVRDISDRKAAERALVASEERFRTFMESLPAAAFLKDADGRFTYVNRYVEDLYGDIVLHQRSGDCFPPGVAEGLASGDERTVAEGSSITTEVIGEPGGRERIWEIHKFRIGEPGPGTQIGGIALDVTERVRSAQERERLEEQIRHTQKLESLGVLAGGIAHDFNNILMAVLGYADLALMDLPSSSPVRSPLLEIEKAARNAADLARQMLAYSGRGSFVIERVQINDLIRDMAHLLEISVSKKATLRLQLDEELPAVNADPTQMRQVVMNLVTNASEALEDSIGVLSITTGTMDCDADFLRSSYVSDDLPGGPYAYLEVSDTGCGMDDDTMTRLFDPFFTTKFTGRGLGLSAVLGIVRGHRGTLRVSSEPGRGTSFMILLPALPGAPVRAAGGQEPGPVDGRPERGRVLLVDDEEHVRSVAGAMLERLGFTVTQAADGGEALERFRADPDGFSCVILDLTMPRMDGEEAFRELRRIRPDAKVILSSGYSEQEVVRKFLGKGLAGFIQKPYRTAELMERIASVLDGTAGGSRTEESG